MFTLEDGTHSRCRLGSRRATVVSAFPCLVSLSFNLIFSHKHLFTDLDVLHLELLSLFPFTHALVSMDCFPCLCRPFLTCLYCISHWLCYVSYDGHWNLVYD